MPRIRSVVRVRIAITVNISEIAGISNIPQPPIWLQDRTKHKLAYANLYYVNVTLKYTLFVRILKGGRSNVRSEK